MNRRELALRFARYSETLDKLNWMARWRETVDVATGPQHADRYELYASVGNEGSPILYLEFGVSTGRSMRYWVNRNRHPDSRFIGFDTFTGLPERWNNQYGEEAFSTKGKLPDISDPRLSFEVGLFQETLRGFLQHRLPSPQHRLIINMDADLYSSTLYVLTTLDSYMPRGTIVLFDEFQSFLHEFRAFCDYTKAFNRSWRLLGSARGGVHAAIEWTD